MMTVELPAPRLGARGCAEKADPVEKLAEFERQAGHLGKRLVELHRFSCRFVRMLAKRHAEKIISELTLMLGELDEAQPVSLQIAVDVAPVTPHLAVERKGTALRSSALSAARKRVAASTIGATVPPGRFENKFCSISPSAVMPRNGSRKASRQLANKSCKGLDTLVSSMRGGACNFKEVVTSDMRGFLPRAPKMMKRRPRCA